MQVKHIAAQVYSAHNHLTARAWPDAILEEAKPQNGKRGGRNISMDEILRMNVGGKGGAKADAAGGSAAAGGAPLSADPMSRVATHGSSMSAMAPVSGAESAAVGAPQVARGIPVQVQQPPPPPAYAPPGIMPHQMGAPVAQAYVVPQPVAPAHPMHVIQQPMHVQPGQVVMPVEPAPPPSEGGAIHAEPPSGAAVRFGSSLAAAEEAAANLSRMLPPTRGPPPGARPGGRAGARTRGGRRG